MSDNKKETFDLTPTWETVAKIILAGLQEDKDAEKIAVEELFKMARVADLGAKKYREGSQPKEELDSKLLETVADIAYAAGHRKFNSGNSREDVSTFISLAKKFEETYKGVDWNYDEDYMEAVDVFTASELDNLENEQEKVPVYKLFPTSMCFYNQHPDLLAETSKIIDTEVQSVAAFKDAKVSGGIVYDVIDPAEMANDSTQVWVVYIRMDLTGMDQDMNPIIAIADFETEIIALEFEHLIRSLLKLPNE